MSQRQGTGQAVIFLVAMALYFFGAPVTSILLGSWWPMLLGIGALLSVVCVLVAVTMVQQSRASQDAEDGTVDEAFEEIVRNGLARNSTEHADAGDLPRPVRKDDDRT